MNQRSAKSARYYCSNSWLDCRCGSKHGIRIFECCALSHLIAAKISKKRRTTVAMIIGVLSLIGGYINMQSIPLPTWMWIEMPLYLVFAWLAAYLVISYDHKKIKCSKHESTVTRTVPRHQSILAGRTHSQLRHC